MPAALSLKKMSALQMQVRNILLQRGGQWTLPTFPDWQLSFAGLAEEPPQTQGDMWMVEATWAGAVFYAYIPTPLFTQWLQNWIPQSTMELPDLPESLLAAVVDGFATQMIDVLARLNKGRLRLNAVRHVSDGQYLPSPFWIHFLFQHVKKQEQFFPILGLDDLGVMVLAQQIKSRPIRTNGIDYHFLSTSVCLSIGTTIISAGRLRQAKLHDVLLFDRIWLDHKGRLFVFVGAGIGFWVIWRDQQLVVDSALVGGVLQSEPRTDQYKGQHMPAKHAADDLDDDEEDWDDDLEDDEEEEPSRASGKSSPPSASAEPVSLNAVEVTLLFDIGEKIMTFEELSQLHKGQVFDLGRPLRRSVAVRAHGSVIAEGELVDVDGHLGVMIHHLVSDHHS